MNKLSISQLASVIKEPAKTLIFCHRNPDPDTLGSAFSLKCILEHFGSSVRVVCPDRVKEKFSFITGGADLSSSFDIDSFERAIAIDVGSQSQLGDYDIYADKIDLIIDHHEMNVRYADYYEDFAPATAMIVYELASELGVLDELPMRFFECVYAGLSGDTGCFKYSNTTSYAMRMGAELIERGIDFSKINYMIFDSRSAGEISAQRMVFDKVELHCNGALALAMVTNETKREYGVDETDISDIVNTIRQIQGVLVAVSIKQVDDDERRFSVSSRANADIDVSALCASIGGGGHPRAAGATVIASSPSEAFEIVRALFSKGVNEYVG